MVRINARTAEFYVINVVLVVHYDVRTPIARKHEEIGPRTSVQFVIAYPAIQNVVATTTLELVPTATAKQEIIPVRTLQHIAVGVLTKDSDPGFIAPKIISAQII